MQYSLPRYLCVFSWHTHTYISLSFDTHPFILIHIDRLEKAYHLIFDIDKLRTKPRFRGGRGLSGPGGYDLNIERGGIFYRGAYRVGHTLVLLLSTHYQVVLQRVAFINGRLVHNEHSDNIHGYSWFTLVGLALLQTTMQFASTVTA